MLLLGVILVVTIPGPTYSVIVESEIGLQNSMLTEENTLRMNSRISQCEDELQGDCEFLPILSQMQ